MAKQINLPAASITRVRFQLGQRSRRGQHAQSLVEAALVMPLFFALLFVTIDLGRAAYTYVIIGQIAQSSARTMSLPDNANSDCNVFSAATSGSNGYTIQADPKSVSGDLEPVAHPTAPTAGTSIPANRGDLYLWPAVASANPPDSSGNCPGNGTARTHTANVTAQVTFRFVPWTPIASTVIGAITLVAVSTVASQY
jgi:hypothetical protein